MATIICNLLGLYLVLIFVRIVLSWFPVNPDGALATFLGLLHLLTDPILLPLRRVLPSVQLGTVALDLSPIVLIVGLQILRGIIC